MATINVKDAAGSTVALEKPLIPGQATMAASRPVVIASDQSTVPVSLASVPSHAVTNAGTFVTQENGSALTSLQLLDDVITAQGTALGTTKTSLVGGSVTTAAPTYTTGQISPISLNTSGAVRVLVDSSQLSALGQNTMANSAPVVIASNQSALPITQGVTATANGGTASRINAAASTNATSLKASAGQLYTIDVFNAAAYNVFLKLYNKASAPTVGSDTPVMTIPVQAGGGYSKTWSMGLPFATGIAYAITKLQADSDTTVVVAGDLTGNTLWI